MFLPVKDAGMNPSRLVWLLFLGGCLLRPEPLPADQGAPPFAMDKQYSADLTITMKDGMSIPSKTYVDGDKLRNELEANGMALVIIVRKDKQKIYQIMASQKMIMETPYDPDKFKGNSGTSFGPEGKFELIGPDTVDGTACTKYKVTSDKTKQIFYFWLDVARKVPVQMAAADGSITVKWKNYKVGPQDAALFEPPVGYQVMAMPIPNLPGTEKPGGEGQ
jgi:outer membrane lipoprotein-sorting protein